jgi:hypothetical protein
MIENNIPIYQNDEYHFDKIHINNNISNSNKNLNYNNNDNYI